MEREILFRGKRIDNGEWVYGYPVMDTAPCSLKAAGKCVCKHDGSYAEIFAWEDEFHEYNLFEVDSATVGRYTGLTDRNGVKIFEGDILQRKVYVYEIGKLQPDRKRMMRGVVIWDETSKIFPPYWAIQAEDEHGNLCKYVFDCEFEVIGNIHDNMELLEVQNEVD